MKTLTADVQLILAGKPMQLKISVPDKKTTAYAVIKPLRELARQAEELAVNDVEANGDVISCAKGCGACCNQLVPVTQIEARYLVDLVERMPKQRRHKYKTRFLESYQRLEQAGVIRQLMDHKTIGDNIVEYGLNYFHLGIPCPFLENNSCSIHTERPLRCREYLVTSPAANCSNPTRDNIRRVNYPVRLSKFLGKFYKPWAEYPHEWVPLSIIFSWVEQHPESVTLRHSREWVEDMLNELSKQKATENSEV